MTWTAYPPEFEDSDPAGAEAAHIVARMRRLRKRAWWIAGLQTAVWTATVLFIAASAFEMRPFFVRNVSAMLADRESLYMLGLQAAGIASFWSAACLSARKARREAASALAALGQENRHHGMA